MKCIYATVFFFVVNSNECKLTNTLLILYSLESIAPFDSWVVSIGITTRDAKPNIRNLMFIGPCIIVIFEE